MIDTVLADLSGFSSLLSSIADLLSAIASLLWPIVAFSLAVLFRKPLRDLIGRLRKGKLLGQELELSESLDNLEQKVASISAEAPLSLPEMAQTRNVESEILELARESPKLALMRLSTELERSALHIVASVGKLREVTGPTLKDSLKALDQHGLPRSANNALKQFMVVRNAVVHGRAATSDDVLRALDSGLVILRGLNSVPHEKHTVYHPGVAIFADPECRKMHSGVKGVILMATTAGGMLTRTSIFPTTKHYEKGATVSWEWNGNEAWGPSWYRDPDTHEIKEAWTGSQEFVGRPLESL